MEGSQKTAGPSKLGLVHGSAGLVLRLRSIADDECKEDEWLADVIRQSANEIERLRGALETVKASTALHAGCGSTYEVVCAALLPNIAGHTPQEPSGSGGCV
jgi:hypothetical protein